MTLRQATLALALAALGCAGTQAPREELTSGSSKLMSCPELAASCPSGCYSAGARPVDEKNKCIGDWQMFGCTANPNPGPPAVYCSVSPNGQRWISIEARLYPGGRHCREDELEAFDYPSCR